MAKLTKAQRKAHAEDEDTAIICEVACFDFAETRERQRETAERRAARLIEAASAARPTHQLALL